MNKNSNDINFIKDNNITNDIIGNNQNSWRESQNSYPDNIIYNQQMFEKMKGSDINVNFKFDKENLPKENDIKNVINNSNNNKNLT